MCAFFVHYHRRRRRRIPINKLLSFEVSLVLMGSMTLQMLKQADFCFSSVLSSPKHDAKN